MVTYDIAGIHLRPFRSLFDNYKPKAMVYIFLPSIETYPSDMALLLLLFLLKKKKKMKILKCVLWNQLL